MTEGYRTGLAGINGAASTRITNRVVYKGGDPDSWNGAPPGTGTGPAGATESG